MKQPNQTKFFKQMVIAISSLVLMIMFLPYSDGYENNTDECTKQSIPEDNSS